MFDSTVFYVNKFYRSVLRNYNIYYKYFLGFIACFSYFLCKVPLFIC